MSELIGALVEVGLGIFKAIQHATAGDKDAALAEALLAQRKLSDAIARSQLT